TDIVEVARNHLIELVLPDEGPGGRHAVFDLEALVNERHRWVRQARIVETRWAGHAIESGISTRPVGARDELPGDVAGADAKLEHHGRVACLRQLEALFDAAHDGLQIR